MAVTIFVQMSRHWRWPKHTRWQSMLSASSSSATRKRSAVVLWHSSQPVSRPSTAPNESLAISATSWK